jgi:hypothetical protein
VIEQPTSLAPIAALGLAAGGGLLTWAGQWLIELFKSRDKVEEHRDGLTFELLDAARSELKGMRDEVSKLRPMEAHLYHLQQALEHIDALLAAAVDQGGLIIAERNARAFLKRMRGISAARVGGANDDVATAGPADLGGAA